MFFTSLLKDVMTFIASVKKFVKCPQPSSLVPTFCYILQHWGIDYWNTVIFCNFVLWGTEFNCLFISYHLLIYLSKIHMSSPNLLWCIRIVYTVNICTLHKHLFLINLFVRISIQVVVDGLITVVVVGQTVGFISSKTLACDCWCTLKLCTASTIATC